MHVSHRNTMILYRFINRYRLHIYIDIISLSVIIHYQSSFEQNCNTTHTHVLLLRKQKARSQARTARSLLPAVDIVIVSLCYKRIACAQCVERGCIDCPAPCCVAMTTHPILSNPQPNLRGSTFQPLISLSRARTRGHPLRHRSPKSPESRPRARRGRSGSGQGSPCRRSTKQATCHDLLAHRSKLIFHDYTFEERQYLFAFSGTISLKSPCIAERSIVSIAPFFALS